MVYAIADSVALIADGRIVEQTSSTRSGEDPGARSSQKLIYTALQLERVLAEAR
jgi:ABC-type methionine transport system ATPase subunit